MQFLKGLAVSLLSFLLFLSLSLLGTAFMLNQTLLNLAFIDSQINKLDFAALVNEIIIEPTSRQINQQFSQQFPQLGQLVTEAMKDTAADLEPWIKEKASEVAFSSYNYFTGKSESLNLTISLEPVNDSLRASLSETILESPPPDLAAVPPAMREQLVNTIEQQLTQSIPAKFELKESAFPPEVQSTLQQVRQAISYFQTAYPLLIGFILLLVLGIVLINRQVKSTTRSLGTTSLTYGVFGYAGIFITKYFSGTQIGADRLPLSLQAWLPQFLSALLSPVETFSIALAAVGLLLVIVSIVYRREKSPGTVSADE